MLADLYAASVSNPGFNWICSPACTELEQVVMDWMARVLGLEGVFRMGSGIGGGIILVSGDLAGASFLSDGRAPVFGLERQVSGGGWGELWATSRRCRSLGQINPIPFRPGRTDRSKAGFWLAECGSRSSRTFRNVQSPVRNRQWSRRNP